MSKKRCDICDRPIASDEPGEKFAEGEGDRFCWGGSQCSNEAVDWRERARKAEIERDKAHRKIERQRVRLKNLENKYLSIKTTLKLGIKDHLDHSYTIPPQWNRDEVIVGLRQQIAELQKRLGVVEEPGVTTEHDKGHMHVVVDVDWATMKCPCGKKICSRFESDAAWNQFKIEHAEHTSGYIRESATARAEVWGATDPNLRPLFPEKQVKE